MESIDVVILAGGKGTRLRPYTASFPKPLVPIGNMPILEIILRQLIAQGFANVTLTLGHLAELIRAYCNHHKIITDRLNISYVDEEQPTGTAGSLAAVDGLNDTFLVMNGDVLTDLDFNALIEAHKSSGAVLTIAAHYQEVKIDLGVLTVGVDDELLGYVEKPRMNYEVSMGVYVYEPSVLNYIKADEYLDFPDLIELLLEAGEPVQVYHNEAFWLDIGHPDDYAKAQEIFEEKPEQFGL